MVPYVQIIMTAPYRLWRIYLGKALFWTLVIPRCNDEHLTPGQIFRRHWALNLLYRRFRTSVQPCRAQIEDSARRRGFNGA